MTFSDLEARLPKVDLWTYLSKNDKPIVMYGMGNGADKIIDVLHRKNIEISDFFASDGFVRGQTFHDKKVMSLSEVETKYKDFIILVSFGSKLEEVICNIEKLSQEHELYLPDVPVSEAQLFDLEFYDSRREGIKKCFELLADDISKSVFTDIILYKLTGKLEYLLNATCAEEEYIKSIFDTSNWKSYLDLGAYNGDTIKQVLEIAPGIKNIIAFEPDAKNFKKLSLYTDTIDADCDVYNLCAWNKKDQLRFERSGNRNSAIDRQSHTASVGDTKLLSVNADTVDNKVGRKHIDYIKFDVEGAEREALEGAKETILQSRPDILMAIYHKSRDLFELPLLIHELLPEYKLYIRRKRCLPAWEINILAKKT